MKSALLFALGIAACTALVPVHAETYQWKDSNGRTVISDTPQPGGGKAARILGGSVPAVVTEKPAEKSAEAPKTTAEKDLDFKKRQQDAREKAEKEAKEQKLTADRQDNCDRARRNLAALESKQPIATYDEKGERRLMDTAQRDAEMDRARQIMAESCK